MIPPMTTTALEELWDITRRANQRMRVHRNDPHATDESVFTLEILSSNGHQLAHIRTKNLESAAQWILDNQRRT